MRTDTGSQMSYPLNRSLISRVLAVLLTAAVCALMGWAVTQHSKLALLPLGLGCALALMLVFANVGWGALCAWAPLGVLLYPLSGHLPGGKYATFDRIWIGGLLVLLLTQPKVRAAARSSRRMLLALTLLMVVLGVRAIVTPATSLYPVRIWMDSLVLPLLLIVLVRRAVGQDRGWGERIALSMMIAGGLLGIIGIGEHVLGFSLTTEVRFDGNIGEVRISGPYAAPETYGLALVMCLAASLYWLLYRRRDGIVHLAGVGVIAIELIAIFYNYFRVGWISALIVVIAAVGLRPGKWSRAILTAAIAGVVLVPLFLLFETLPAVKQRVTNTQNIYVRLATYEQGWHIFKSAPVFGVGAERYNNVAVTLPTYYVNGYADQPYAHSSLFAVMAEDGIVGLIPLLLVAVAVFGLIRALGSASRRRRSSPDALLASVLAAAGIAYLIYSLTLTMLPYAPSNQMFAILLGIGAGRLDLLSVSKPSEPVSEPIEAGATPHKRPLVRV